MQFSRIKAATALLAATVAASAVAGSAQASVVPGGGAGSGVPSLPTVVVDNDPFADLLQDSEVTFTGGNVAWEWGNRTVTPRVTGTMHVVKGDDARFRVRVNSYDKNGKFLGRAYDDKDGHPRHSDAAKDYTIDMTGVGGPDVRSVQVAVQKEGDDDWKTKDESGSVKMDLFSDSVTIDGQGIDVGGIGISNGHPTDPAIVDWTIGDDGALKATYEGYLHLKDSYAAPGRVVIRSVDPLTGIETGRDEGDAHDPSDNGTMDTLSVDSADTKLVVEMQAYVTDADLHSSWQVIGSASVSVAE